MRLRSIELALSLIVALVLCAPGASMGQGLSDDTTPTETLCDPGDVFVPDPTGLGLLWAADDGDGFWGCGPGIPVPVCNMSLPNDLFCDLDAVTFDVGAHPQVPPPVSISLDDGDVSPNGPPLSNAVELSDVLPPGPPVAALTEAALLLTANPPPEGADDDVDGFETNMTAGLLPHPAGYFFDFSTDADNPCGLDPGDIYLAQCPGFTMFCDDVIDIQIPDDCDIDALHLIDPSAPFPAGNPPGVPSQGWGYLFSIDANSGPACLGAMDPGDIYYTECSRSSFIGTTLWADDVVDLGMVGCDNPGANTQNNPGYCDIDAISVVITTTTTTTTLPVTTTTTTTVPTTTTTTITTASTTTTTTSSSTTTTTLAPVCAAAPIGGCVGPEKGILLVKEKVAGKEKIKAVIKKLKSTVSQGDFGDPVGGTTSYTVCIYDDADALVGQMVVARAGQDCGTPARPCWKAISTKGYKYKDKDTSADGILKIIEKGGAPGQGKLILLGKNNSSKGQLSLPTGIAPLLQNNSKATVQVVTSDAACFGVTTDQVKKADADLFKALGGSPSGAFLDMASGVVD